MGCSAVVSRCNPLPLPSLTSLPPLPLLRQRDTTKDGAVDLYDKWADPKRTAARRGYIAVCVSVRGVVGAGRGRMSVFVGDLQGMFRRIWRYLEVARGIWGIWAMWRYQGLLRGAYIRKHFYPGYLWVPRGTWWYAGMHRGR